MVRKNNMSDEEDVKTYRCIFYFTEDKYKDTPPSNIFVHETSKDKAGNGSLAIFKEALKSYGLPDAKFRQEVYLSSEEEMIEYKKNKELKTSYNRIVN